MPALATAMVTGPSARSAPRRSLHRFLVPHVDGAGEVPHAPPPADEGIEGVQAPPGRQSTAGPSMRLLSPVAAGRPTASPPSRYAPPKEDLMAPFEVRDPRLHDLVAPDAPIERVAGGLVFTE